MPRKPAAPRPAQKHRVLLVDDHPLMRQGLAWLINQEADLIVCGEAHETGSAMEAVSKLRPDIVVLDITLGGRDGIDFVKVIRASHPELPILVLSMHDESLYAERALRAGANGYITKQEAPETVLVAMRRILSRELYFSDRVANKMLQQAVRPKNEQRTPVATLSDRELEVFRLIGEGRGTRQIASELQLSVKTVETYQAHIKQKLSLRSARELMKQAIQWQLGEKVS